MEPLREPPSPELLLPGKDGAFVFLPERRGELDLVRQTFPGGELREIPSPYGNRETMYTLYLFPPSRTAGRGVTCQASI